VRATPNWTLRFPERNLDAPDPILIEYLAEDVETALNLIKDGQFAVAVTDGTPHIIGDYATEGDHPIGVWTSRKITPLSGMTITSSGIHVTKPGTYEAIPGLSFDNTQGTTGRRGTWPTVNGVSTLVPQDDRSIIPAAPGGTTVPGLPIYLDLVAGDTVSAIAYHDVAGQYMYYFRAHLSLRRIAW
jgi:hypothetical protein